MSRRRKTHLCRSIAKVWMCIAELFHNFSFFLTYENERVSHILNIWNNKSRSRSRSTIRINTFPQRRATIQMRHVRMSIDSNRDLPKVVNAHSCLKYWWLLICSCWFASTFTAPAVELLLFLFLKLSIHVSRSFQISLRNLNFWHMCQKLTYVFSEEPLYIPIVQLYIPIVQLYIPIVQLYIPIVQLYIPIVQLDCN